MSNEERSLSPINLDPNSWFDRYMEAWLEENFERFAENWYAKRARDDRWQERQDFLDSWRSGDDPEGTTVTYGGPSVSYEYGVARYNKPEWYEGRSFTKTWSDEHKRLIWVDTTGMEPDVSSQTP